MRNVMRKADLYFQTTRHLSRKQLIHRMSFIIKKKMIYKLPVIKNNILETENKIPNLVEVGVKFSLEESNIDEIDKLHKLKINDFINRKFTFLNSTFEFPSEINWKEKSMSQLWMYNLHYFDYIKDLSVYAKRSNDKLLYNSIKSIILSWREQNNVIGIGDGWHPYTVSLRLCNFVYCYTVLEEMLNKDEEFRDILYNLIFVHMNFLKNNLEHDVRGNHLFENIRALLTSSLFFYYRSFGQELLFKAEKLMKEELNEQILEDGGHFERTPMYHNIVLKGLMDLAYLYRCSPQNKEPEFIQEKIKKMYGFMISTIHPDNEIALFNDSVFDNAHSPDYIVEYFVPSKNKKKYLTTFDEILKNNQFININSNISQVSSFIARESGYFVSRDSKNYSIIDFGKPCPDYLPAHAHADIFSFELSVNNKRFIVDTGTYEYKAGFLRDYSRSTIAHNTLTYNEENQSEVWGSFRVAARAKVIKEIYKVNSVYNYFAGIHDGYKNKYGLFHKRHFIHVFEEGIVVIDEVISINKIDVSKVESHIHFAPNINIENNIIENIETKDKVEFNLINSINRTKNLEKSYFPEFGKSIPINSMSIRPKNHQKNHLFFGYVLNFKGNIKTELIMNELTLMIKEEKIIKIQLSEKGG